MNKVQLANVLKWRWWLHTALTSLFFICLAFFFFFVIEDKLYEDQLKHIAAIVAQNQSLQHLPPHIQRFETAQLPKAWQAQLNQVESAKAIEVYDTDGVPIHLLRIPYDKGQSEFILALDTSKTDSIWAIADKLLLLILPWMVIFLLLATILANRFTGQIHRHFEQLLNVVKQSDCAQPLWQFAQQQKIDELAQFATLFAQAWQQKLDIVTREKQSLTYLSHELRTPLQSSIATLELMALKMPEQQHIERLHRSLNRMTRLSNTILCLMESAKPQSVYSLDVLPVCQQLIDELRLIAATKHQDIQLIHPFGSAHTQSNDNPSNQAIEIRVLASKEAIETILSILLTNALTHSNQQPIVVTLAKDQMSIANETLSCHQRPAEKGYGIGLTIAQRLADKFNLSLTFSAKGLERFVATLSWQR